MESTRHVGEVYKDYEEKESWISILKTKLHVPQPRHNPVLRTRLFNKLELYPTHRLTAISAPAGYGKTTMICTWLKKVSIPYTWLSLDTSDNEPVRFFSYFVEGLKRLDPRIGENMRGWFTTAKTHSFDQLMDLLICDVEQYEEHFLLILDDYHLIHNKAIHESIQYLLNHPLANMHLILLTREQLPLSLARLRARGQLTEVDIADLCFDTEEIEEFFQRTMEVELNSESIKVLGERTEGWVAGLQLAGLSLRKMEKEKITQFIQGFSGNNQYIMSYLVEEVLNYQESDTILFLYQTSVLPKFTPSLCDYLLDRKNSREIITYLDKANLFVIALDDQGEWYRYHHLLSEFLARNLGAAEKEHLNLKAAQWWEEHGFLSEAVNHSIESKNIEEMERLIGKSAEETLKKIEFLTLFEWIERLPEQRILDNGNLLSYRAWCYFLLGRPDEAIQYISSVENLEVVQNNKLYLGRLKALKSAILSVRGKIEALEYAQESLELIGNADTLFQLKSLNAIGNSYLVIGKVHEAIQAFHRSLFVSEKHYYYTQCISATFFLTTSLNRGGYRREAEELCFQLIEKYKDYEDKTLSVYSLYVPLGICCYEKDDLLNANRYLTEGVKICSQVGILHILGEGEWSLALLQYACGDVKSAYKTLHDAKKTASREGFSKVVTLLSATEAEFHLREGNMTRALKWVEETKLYPEIEIQPLFDLQHFTYGRILIAQNKLEDAKILLNKLENSAASGKRYASLIVIYLLQATRCKLSNCKLEALNYLERAVEIGAPEEYYRSFINDGEALLDLFPMVRKNAPKFIDKLIEKLNYSSEKEVQEKKKEDFNQLLTFRETEILNLVSFGLSNEEIADKLFITLGTVKNHIFNIYTKLGVRKRTQAVARAKELKLL